MGLCRKVVMEVLSEDTVISESRSMVMSSGMETGYTETWLEATSWSSLKGGAWPEMSARRLARLASLGRGHS